MGRLSTDRQDCSPSFILFLESPLISRDEGSSPQRDEANWNCLESRNQPATFVSLVSLPFPRVSKSANSNLAEEHERIHSPCEKFSSNLQKFCYLSSGPGLSSSSLYKASAVALSTTLRISGWKLLQFRIHRLTQLPRGYVSITVLPSLPSSGGEEEVMKRF